VDLPASDSLSIKRSITAQIALDSDLYDKTLKEVQQGWLVGPLKWEDLEDTAVVSRRFGIVQGQKLRPIDD